MIPVTDILRVVECPGWQHLLNLTAISPLYNPTGPQWDRFGPRDEYPRSLLLRCPSHTLKDNPSLYNIAHDKHIAFGSKNSCPSSTAPLLEEAWDTFFVADAQQLVNTMCPQLGLIPFSMNILWYPKGQPGVGPHHDPSAYPAIVTLTIRGSATICLHKTLSNDTIFQQPVAAGEMYALAEPGTSSFYHSVRCCGNDTRLVAILRFIKYEDLITLVQQDEATKFPIPRSASLRSSTKAQRAR